MGKHRECAAPPAGRERWRVTYRGRSQFAYGQTAWKAWQASKFRKKPYSEIRAKLATPQRKKKMTRSRRKKTTKTEQPKKVIQIAAAPSGDGPVLYALTDEGEIYEYGVVEDEKLGADVGMWEPLSSIESRNIVGDAEVDEDE